LARHVPTTPPFCLDPGGFFCEASIDDEGDGGDGRGWPRWEETFEDALGLPLCRVGEINPHVHTSSSAQRGIKTLDVIGRGEKRPVGDDKKPI
jgi:hypothetical protein